MSGWMLLGAVQSLGADTVEMTRPHDGTGVGYCFWPLDTLTRASIPVGPYKGRFDSDWNT